MYTGWSCIITDIRWPTVAAGAQVAKPSLPTGAGHWVPDLYNRKTGLNKRELTWTREAWLEHKKPDLNKRSIWFEDAEDEQKKKMWWKQLFAGMHIVLWVQKTRCKTFLCGSLGINITKSWFKPRQTNIDPWWCRCSWRPPWPNGRLCATSLRCLTRFYQATTNYCQPQLTTNYFKLPSRKNSALLLRARIVSIALLQLHLVFVCVPKMSAHRYVNHSCHPIPDLHSSVTVLERHQMSYPSISVSPRCSLALIKMGRDCIVSWSPFFNLYQAIE